MNHCLTTKTFTDPAPSGTATGWDMLPACPSVERNNQVRATTDSEHGDGCSTLSGASVVRYQLHDAQGNTIGLVDNDQEVSTVYLQDSWGIPLVDTDCQTVSLASSPIQVESVPNPYRWGGAHGYYADEDVGMYLMGLRWYDAFTCRFITRDPVGFAAGDMNQYRPMGNNPVNAVDPWGLFPPDASELDAWWLDPFENPRVTGHQFPWALTRDLELPRAALHVPPSPLPPNPPPGTLPTTFSGTLANSIVGDVATMKATLTFTGGTPQNVVILWGTCDREDGSAGFMPWFNYQDTATVDLSKFASRRRFLGVYGMVTNEVYVRFLSWENNKWKVHVYRAGGAFTYEKRRWTTSGQSQFRQIKSP